MWQQLKNKGSENNAIEETFLVPQRTFQSKVLQLTILNSSVGTLYSLTRSILQCQKQGTQAFTRTVLFVKVIMSHVNTQMKSSDAKAAKCHLHPKWENDFDQMLSACILCIYDGTCTSDFNCWVKGDLLNVQRIIDDRLFNYSKIMHSQGGNVECRYTLGVHYL